MDIQAFGDFHDLAGNAGLVYYYSGHFDEDVRRSLAASLAATEVTRKFCSRRRKNPFRSKANATPKIRPPSLVRSSV